MQEFGERKGGRERGERWGSGEKEKERMVERWEGNRRREEVMSECDLCGCKSHAHTEKGVGTGG